MYVFEFVFNELDYTKRKEITVVANSAQNAVNYFTEGELKGLCRMIVKPAVDALIGWIPE